MTRKVVIVGAGASGVAAMIALVARGAAGQIDLVDPRPAGHGFAFDTNDPALLCNTPVDTMSLVPDAPDDFLRFLHGEGLSATPNDFVPRSHFKRYAIDRYQKYRGLAASAGVALRHVPGRATGAHCPAGGGYQVRLADGSALPADDVLVCLGFGAPVVPRLVLEHVGARSLFLSPYPESALLGGIGPQARVLVLGTRLSAIDTTVLLCREEGRRVVMASPSGTLPAVRTRMPRTSTPRIDAARFRSLDFRAPSLARRVQALVARACGARAPRFRMEQDASYAGAVGRLRAEVRLAAEGRTSWQDVLVEAIDLAIAVLREKDGATREAAVRSCHELLVRYLAAFPLATARRLLDHLEAGRASVSAGVPQRLDRSGDGWRAVWPDGRVEDFDAVVCATGFHKPQFHAGRDALEFLPDPSRRCTPPEVTQDLRVRLPGRAASERVWLVGVSSHPLVPLVNAVYQAARQSDAIARQLARDAFTRQAACSS